MIILT